MTSAGSERNRKASIRIKELPKYDNPPAKMTAHAVRRIRVCVCGGIGDKDEMLESDPGIFYHGRCALKGFGLRFVRSLGRKQTNKLTLDDIGPTAMKKLLSAGEPK